MAELRIGSATDTGRVRPENEDNFLVTGTAFVVADGMGGHEAGEVASQIAVDGIRQRLAAIAASGDSAEPVAILPAAASSSARSPARTPTSSAPRSPTPPTAAWAPRSRPSPSSPIRWRGAEHRTSATRTKPTLPATPRLRRRATSHRSSRRCRRKRSCSPTSAIRAPTCSATTVCGVSRSITATSRSWWPPGTSARTRPVPIRGATSSPGPSASSPTCASTGGRCRLIRGDRFVLCSDGLVDEVADTDITTILLDTRRSARGRRSARRRGQRRAAGATTSP